MQCAIYARYSSDLQRPSSIEDQIRRCRAYAESQGWAIVDQFIISDAAVSGASMHNRPGLEALVQHAKRRPKPFDCLLIEDTSRLSRDLSDSLKLTARLDFYGVRVFSVSQGIDTGQKSSRQVLALQGIIDEQYLTGLAEKVHRGQEGRVLKGQHPGGRCFGYRSVPIEDPTRRGKYGRPEVSGVQQVVDSNEAAVVRRIFQMCADGISLKGIAKTLNSEGIPPPQSRKEPASWYHTAVRAMLRNERYRGRYIWNRTRKQIDPETGRKTSRRRPKCEWVEQLAPELRIVSEDLWKAAHTAIEAKRKFGNQRNGGMNRTDASRQYIFSGILKCGLCGRRLVIVSGTSKKGNGRYGCPGHRNQGVCENTLTIRQSRLEEQLLAAIEERLREPKMMARIVTRFRTELDARLKSLKSQHSSQEADLPRRRQKLQEQAGRITDAIAAAGHSEALLKRLSQIEADLEQVNSKLASAERAPKWKIPTAAQAEKFVRSRLPQLKRLAEENPSAAKKALTDHVKELKLTPADTSSGPVFAVEGKMNLLSPPDAMLLVAGEGFEPSTFGL